MDARRAPRSSRRSPRRAVQNAFLGAVAVCLVAGCATAAPSWWPFKTKSSDPAAAPAPTDSFIMRGLGLEKETGDTGALNNELEGAKRLYQNKEYAKAEPIFHRLASLRKGPINVIEESLYYEADCQRLQGDYRSAEGTYLKYLKDFRNQGQHTEQTIRRLFDIANYWLDDTRKLMQAYEEKREGKRWLVTPASYVHMSKDKPLYDAEGHALRILEEIRLNDIRGPMGEKALFYMATVKFFREDYRDADYYYSELYKSFPNSQLAAKAMKQSIICKQIMHGGTDYDTRSVEESRKLIDSYQNAYPEWNKDKEWLTRQLSAVHLQQADRDYKVGEFYRRTGHPGSAYFYFELVRRRYPGTEYARKAEDRMGELRGLADAEKQAVVQRPANAFTAIPPAPPAPDSGAFAPRTPPASVGFAPVPAPVPAPVARAPVAAAPFAPVPSVAPPVFLPSAPMPPAAVLGPPPSTGSEPPPPLAIAPSNTGTSLPRLLPPSFGPR